jgi:predicted metal-dependent hydrolase
MRQDGVTGAGAWLRLNWYMWGRPGVFRKIMGAWASYFLPRFHPWRHDDRHLIEAYEESRPQSLAADEDRRVRGAR